MTDGINAAIFMLNVSVAVPLKANELKPETAFALSAHATTELPASVPSSVKSAVAVLQVCALLTLDAIAMISSVDDPRYNVESLIEVAEFEDTPKLVVSSACTALTPVYSAIAIKPWLPVPD